MNWTLKDGNKEIPCDTFPYAFRRLWNIRYAGLNPNKERGELKRTLPEMMKSLSIVGPPPAKRKYGYSAAVDMARGMGLLNAEGNINGREFKRR